MNNRSQRLLQEIEAGALDQETPIVALLRKVIILGGQAGSEEMHDWASREVDGYADEDVLPRYRRFSAPLCVDIVNMRGKSTGQKITPMHLPEEVRGHISNRVDLRMHIAEVEAYSRQSPPEKTLKVSPPGSEMAVAIMNSHGSERRVLDLYWAMSPVVFEDVVDQVRTTLTKMVGELRATMPDGTAIPSAATATNAMIFAVTGKRNKMNVTAAQDESTVPAPLSEDGFPLWAKVVGGIVTGLLAIIGVVLAYMEVQGLKFVMNPSFPFFRVANR